MGVVRCRADETALVVPVPEAEPLVGPLRRLHTVGGAAGMPPHITLVYPFAGAITEGILRRLGDVLAGFPVFDLTMSETHRLEWTGETVLSLRPDPSKPFVAMTEAIVAEFPEYPPYGGIFDEIVPHLTAAISTDLALLDRLESELAAGLPLVASVEAAGLFEPTPDGWRLHTRLELARAETP
jgi:hypothetical protein